MTIAEFSTGLFKVDHDGSEYLGIAIGPAQSTFARNALASHQQIGSLFGSDGQNQRSWVIEGLVTHGETLIAYGPWKLGATKGSSLLNLEKDRALGLLAALSRAFATLDQTKTLLHRGLFLDGIVLFPDNSFLILPAKLQETMLALYPVAEKQQSHEILRLAAQSVTDSYAFGLSVLAFRVATGRYPFEICQDYPQITSLMVHGVSLTPACIFPTINMEIEKVFHRFLVKHDFGRESLIEIGETIETWRRNVVLMSPLANLQNNSPAMTAYNKRLASHHRRRFFQRNRLRILLITALSLLVLAVPITMLGHQFRTLAIHGMKPEQVVAAYYNAFNTLDTTMMTDATIDAAGKKQIELVTNLYVLDRVRFANEHRKIHFSPLEWRQAATQINTEDVMIFGVDKVTIREIQDQTTPAGRVFIVSYDIWSNLDRKAKPDQPSGQPETTPVITPTQDRLVLVQRKDGIWQIKEIKPLVAAGLTNP